MPRSARNELDTNDHMSLAVETLAERDCVVFFVGAMELSLTRCRLRNCPCVCRACASDLMIFSFADVAFDVLELGIITTLVAMTDACDKQALICAFA